MEPPECDAWSRLDFQVPWAGAGPGLGLRLGARAAPAPRPGRASLRFRQPGERGISAAAPLWCPVMALLLKELFSWRHLLASWGTMT